MTDKMKAIFSWKMIVMAALGFSSGFPFLIIKDVIKAWMTDASVDITTIGLFSALSLPYTLKFLWSPVMDAVPLPFLGRRRGWMITIQVALLLTIAVLGQFDPATNLWTMAVICLTIAFFGASQDIVLDAFRREFLTDEELGLGNGIWMNTWRLANLASIGVAFALSDRIGWDNTFLILSLMMGVGIVTTLFVPEPKVDAKAPHSLKEAVLEPFQEFFKRDGALLILLFIMLYKVGDNMASAMNIPFILDLGFSKTEYFVIVKAFGLAALFGGAFVGGLAMVWMGTNKALWVFGAFQAVSTAGFALLYFAGKNHYVFSGVVAFEFFSTGLGQTALATFIALQTNKKFTATQFALMTSLMAVPLTVVAALTGFMVKFLGWPDFYLLCAASAIPGFLLLTKIAPWGEKRPPTPA